MADTSSSHDHMRIRLDVPLNVGSDGGTSRCQCGDAKPWGAPPEKLSVAKEILGRTAALLELLQRAQLDGDLTEEGLCELQSLQRFYTALKIQVDKGGQ